MGSRTGREKTMKKVYPVIFTKTEECVLVEVPDLSIITEATDMVEAIDMARDAIGLRGITMEDLGQVIPETTAISLSSSACSALRAVRSKAVSRDAVSAVMMASFCVIN